MGVLPVRLVRREDALRLEVTCGCGELASLDVLEPFGTCGAELEPDAGENRPHGNRVTMREGLPV